MLSCARTIIKIPFKRPSKILFPNQSSNIFLGKLKKIQRQNLPVETERASLFRRLYTSTAVKLERPINSAVKCETFISLTSLKLPTNDFQFSANFTVTTDSYNDFKLSQVFPILDNPNIGSGIKLIEKTDMFPSKFDILSNKLRDIQPHLLMGQAENLQLLCKVESNVPTAKVCEYKDDHNFNKSLLASRSGSILLKINTVMSRMMSYQLNTGQSARRNFSNKSGKSTNLEYCYCYCCFFLQKYYGPSLYGSPKLFKVKKLRRGQNNKC
jgi:hypothetical protein